MKFHHGMSFWHGFVKRDELLKQAGAIEAWQEESKEENAKAEKKDDEVRVESRELSEWRSPDVYHRYWP